MKLSRWWDPLGIFQGPKEKRTPPEAFKSTTAQEGSPVGVLWGTRDIKSSNITFWGDVKTVAIKSGGKK